MIRPRNDTLRSFLQRGRGRTKYHNTHTTMNGWRFDSQKEAGAFYLFEKIRAAGKIRLVLRQVPFHLPGHTIYRLDFLVIEASGGVRFFDVKGVRTQTYKIKKRQVEELYGIRIEEI